VYFFNSDEETNLLVETRRDVVVGRRLRFQTESSVDTAAAADAQSAVPSLTSSDTSQLPPRKIIQRRVQVDARSPPPPIFLQQQPAATSSSSDTSTTSTTSSTTATTATSDTPAAAVAVEPPRLKSPPPTLPTLLDPEAKTRASDDKDDDSDGSSSDESPPPLQLSPGRAATKSVAVTSPRSPRGGAAADTSVAASAPSRFGDTGEWLSSNPVRPSQPSLNLAKHREDGSLDRRADALSPRALSASPEVSPKKHKHKHKASSSSKPTEELDAVIAIVDDHETRRQQKAVEN
jgi:hypothetical protein